MKLREVININNFTTEDTEMKKKEMAICVKCEHHFWEGSDFCKAHPIKDEVDPISGKMKSEICKSYRIGYRICFLLNLNGKCRKFKEKK